MAENDNRARAWKVYKLKLDVLQWPTISKHELRYMLNFCTSYLYLSLEAHLRFMTLMDIVCHIRDHGVLKFLFLREETYQQ